MSRKTERSRYLITPSLLNSWGYIWEAPKGVKEAESDLICLEDKKDIAVAKAKEDFLRVLERLPSEPNKYMQAGIDFEKECYEGKTCVSPIIEGGAFQIVGKKEITIDNVDYLMYGRLDVLKGGVIYDIKRCVRYAPQKYISSYQHGFYMDLFPEAYKFVYLAFDGNALHQETYYREQCRDTEQAIKAFHSWLVENDLIDLYEEKWKSRKDR